MKLGVRELLMAVRDLAPGLRGAGAVFSGEAAAHVHVAAGTGTEPGGAPRYAALPVANLAAIVPGTVALPGVVADHSAVADAVRGRLDLFATAVALGDGTVVPVLRREAVLACLLARGGLAIALAGLVVRVAGPGAIDADEVREILKAAGQGERFQPLLELLDVA